VFELIYLNIFYYYKGLLGNLSKGKRGKNQKSPINSQASDIAFMVFVHQHSGGKYCDPNLYVPVLHRFSFLGYFPI